MSFIEAIEMNNQEDCSYANSNINKDTNFIFDKKGRGYIAYKFDSGYRTELSDNEYEKRKRNSQISGSYTPVAKNRRFYINFILTRKEHRKKGVFKTMFLELVNIAIREKIGEIHLHCDEYLTQLYFKVGFRQEKKQIYHSPPYLLRYDIEDGICHENIILHHIHYNNFIDLNEDTNFTFEDLLIKN